ncbi:HAD-IA family hydrolase [Streptomyces sp. NPDC002131]|uniref:HAD family hydrolase n=1 Tax=unclassified Streptomyces TaxID=2593676 RepID=UPI002DDB164B|nr:HAD-IA family hydrolase [Streptomyces sp. NBC_01558]WSD78927.1 HAD-IA family hydrolase [Streptomyces sp. NBC_01558]
MTSETAQAEATATRTAKLRDAITRARFVLFDFDGPVCRLFAGHSAERVAQDLVEWLERQGMRGLLTAEERVHPDPMVVLHAVNRRRPHSDLVAELEARFTQQELKAVVSAWPTAYADPVIRTWSAVGARLAITTNNSPQTASHYLADRGLTECFTPNIYGRTQDLHHLKPDPHCLNRALNALGAAPSTALMIGDAPSDLQAAQRAGVPFLGYARNERTEKLLRDAGAEDVVGSLETVLRILRGQL